MYKIVIPDRLESLNKYLSELSRHPVAGNRMKQRDEHICVTYIRQALKGKKLKAPIIIHYGFYEKNTKRDRMNVFSYADKVFQDSLQKAGNLDNDNWHNVYNTTHDFFVDARNPRIEIVIEEVGEDKRQFFLDYKTV